jgi:hypothetical protein
LSFRNELVLVVLLWRKVFDWRTRDFEFRSELFELVL